MISVVIIGLGNIGSHLYRALKKVNGVKVNQLYNRSPEQLKTYTDEVETTSNITKIIKADIYIIATKDDSIGDISEILPFSNRLVVHTSGSLPIQTLDNTNRRGSFYPVQTFSKEVLVDFKTIPLCIEAENKKDLQLLHKLAKKLSDTVFKITSEQRKSIHLAAVFVNNFTNHLYHIGEEICTKNKVPFTILSPLLKETAAKLDTLSAYNAQTGPAKRNDTGTMQKHLQELKNETHKKIYKVISKSITNTYGKKL